MRIRDNFYNKYYPTFRFMSKKESLKEKKAEKEKLSKGEASGSDSESEGEELFNKPVKEVNQNG